MSNEPGERRRRRELERARELAEEAARGGADATGADATGADATGADASGADVAGPRDAERSGARAGERSGPAGAPAAAVTVAGAPGVPTPAVPPTAPAGRPLSRRELRELERRRAAEAGEEVPVDVVRPHGAGDQPPARRHARGGDVATDAIPAVPARGAGPAVPRPNPPAAGDGASAGTGPGAGTGHAPGAGPGVAPGTGAPTTPGLPVQRAGSSAPRVDGDAPASPSGVSPSGESSSAATSALTPSATPPPASVPRSAPSSPPAPASPPAPSSPASTSTAAPRRPVPGAPTAWPAVTAPGAAGLARAVPQTDGDAGAAGGRDGAVDTDAPPLDPVVDGDPAHGVHPDEVDGTPHRYTWKHYVALALVAFVLGFLVWSLVNGETESGAVSAALLTTTTAATGSPTTQLGDL